MNNDIEKKDIQSKPEYYVVVKDKADKALTLFEQAAVNGHLIDLNVLKTCEEFKIIDPESHPEAGNLYIFSDFTQKYIKADNNDAIQKDSALRCRMFSIFCGKCGVKSVRYKDQESNSNKSAKEYEAQAEVQAKGTVNGKIEGSFDSSSAEKNKSKVDYTFDGVQLGNYNASDTENFYKKNNLERFHEFAVLYDRWKQKSLGNFSIDLEYFSQMSGRRAVAFAVSGSIKKICGIKLEYQQQAEFENIKSLKRSIEVEFFPPEYFQEHERIEGEVVEISEAEPTKRSMILWCVLAFVAACIAVLILGLFKFLF